MQQTDQIRGVEKLLLNIKQTTGANEENSCPKWRKASFHIMKKGGKN